MENSDDGRRAGSGETFYGTHESETNMVMSEKVSNFDEFHWNVHLCIAIWSNISSHLLSLLWQ